MSKAISLSDKQQEVLSALLERALGDLSYEIANTDLSSFKDQLKERKAELEAIAAQLAE